MAPLPHSLSTPGSLPENVGPFRILGLLGEGGMGSVYLAERAEVFEQRVAIKVLDRSADPVESDSTLSDEGRILTALDHANIVRLLDWGSTPGGQPYLVMEYVEGMTIDRFCDDRRFSTRERLRVLVSVVNAVEYAHRHLVIHADLKPSNILVTAEGQAKLLDFGISTLNGAETGEAANALTPAFASPEQMTGDRITVATDVYALGRIGQVLLAGSKQRPDADLTAVLEKATLPEAEQRYASAQALGDDLQRWLDGKPVSAREASPLRRMAKWADRHRWSAAASAVALLLLLTVAIGSLMRAAEARRERRTAEARLRDLVRLTGALEGELYNTVAPLNGSVAARRSLLATATATLDSLAEDNGRDPAITRDIADQYRRLASMQEAEQSPEAAAVAQADRAKADLLLRPK